MYTHVTQRRRYVDTLPWRRGYTLPTPHLCTHAQQSPSTNVKTPQSRPPAHHRGYPREQLPVTPPNAPALRSTPVSATGPLPPMKRPHHPASSALSPRPTPAPGSPCRHAQTPCRSPDRLLVILCKGPTWVLSRPAPVPRFRSIA